VPLAISFKDVFLFHDEGGIFAIVGLEDIFPPSFFLPQGLALEERKVPFVHDPPDA